MKWLLLKLFLFCLPFLILIVTINYLIDPANLSGNGKYEKGIAKLLCDSLNVTNIYNYDERQMERSFIECMHKEPEIIILGSSRTMLLSSDMFKTSNVKNNSVSGASIEDYLAIIDIYEERNIIPQTIIIGIDPYIFNENNSQNRWKSIASNSYSMLGKIGLSINSSTYRSKIDEVYYKFKKQKEILSFTYFQKSLEAIVSGYGKKYYPTTIKENDSFTRIVDGSIVYDKKYREKTVEEIDNEARIYISSNPIYSLGNFERISPRVKNILEKLIEYLKTKNIQIYLLLTPYHPIVYDFFLENNNYNIVLETEEYLKQISTKYKIKVVGSLNPYKYNLTNKDFYDGSHCTKESIRKVLLNGISSP